MFMRGANLADLDPLSFNPIYDREELDGAVRILLRMEFATTETEVHLADISPGEAPPAHELLASLTNKVIARANLTCQFAQLYPLVRQYVINRCFGAVIDLEDEHIRQHLRDIKVQEGIAQYLARKISELTAVKRTIAFDNADFRLSGTNPFTWRRNLPPLVCRKTVFNYVATYNDYEKDFARFLDNCPDITRFAALGTTEQESGTCFKIDYLKLNGAIGFYYPDWVAVQTTGSGELNWIIETKGREWESTSLKDTAIGYWCTKISAQTGNPWDFVRIDQNLFQSATFTTFDALLAKKNKEGALPI